MIDPLSLRAHRVLVIAPHPDDEALGCGGLIARLTGDGRRVMIVFITDGGASHPNSLDWPRWRLARQRRDEAIAAASLLGVPRRDTRFLDLEDANMPAAGSALDARAVRSLALIVSDFAPDLAILPWRRDPHRDHRDAWRLSRDAIRGSGQAISTLEYAVWLDELGAPQDQPRAGEAERLAFDVTPSVAAKCRAVDAHISQTTDLIKDDPTGFRLTRKTIDRLCAPQEIYWRPLA